jgi:hypothetical protein
MQRFQNERLRRELRERSGLTRRLDNHHLTRKKRTGERFTSKDYPKKVILGPGARKSAQSTPFPPR